jgi:hypothetical protein
LARGAKANSPPAAIISAFAASNPATDILGDYAERIPRHAKAYRNFLQEYNRLQNERIAAFKEYADDVKSGRFPEAHHLVDMGFQFTTRGDRVR